LGMKLLSLIYPDSSRTRAPTLPNAANPDPDAPPHPASAFRRRRLPQSVASGRTHMGRFSSSVIYHVIQGAPASCGSEVRAHSHHAATMTASTHIRSGSIRPYHDPSFSRALGSGGMGSISLRRHVAATSVHDHHPPGSGASVIRPIRGLANMS
jgi:hypothetical protein